MINLFFVCKVTGIYIQGKYLKEMKKNRFTIKPVTSEKAMTNPKYSKKRFIPRTIFNAPRFVIFVDGPVIMNAAALPMLIPFQSHCCKRGMVPPPQAYKGTPMVAAIKIPKPSLSPNR